MIISGNTYNMYRVKFNEPKEKTIFIPCNCKSEVVGLSKYDDEDEIYLTVYKYSSISFSFFTRIKMAWKVIKGESIDTADVVLSKENFEKIKEFL